MIKLWKSVKKKKNKPVKLEYKYDFLFFFFFLFFSFIIIIIILLYNIVLVLPYINMHLPRVYTCSPSWTLLPPPSPYHPSGSSQCTSPKLPVSCIEPGLAIHFLYDIIHVLMPFSQIIPLSLYHRVQKTVLYICVFLSPHSSVGKGSAYNAGDPSSIPGSGRSAGEGIGYPL